MNPKPFFVSNHFTLPDAICFSIHLSSFSPVWQTAAPRASQRRCTSKDFAATYRKSLALVNAGVGANPAALEQRALERIFGLAGKSYIAKPIAVTGEIDLQNTPALHCHFDRQGHVVREVRGDS